MNCELTPCNFQEKPTIHILVTFVSLVDHPIIGTFTLNVFAFSIALSYPASA